MTSPDGPVGGIHRQRVRVRAGRPEVLGGVAGAALVATLHTQPDAVGQLGSRGYRLWGHNGHPKSFTCQRNTWKTARDQMSDHTEMEQNNYK